MNVSGLDWVIGKTSNNNNSNFIIIILIIKLHFDDPLGLNDPKGFCSDFELTISEETINFVFDDCDDSGIEICVLD